MLESLTADVFSARIGDRFRLHVTPDHAIEVELIEATVLGSRPGKGRTPFSILFRGPMTPVLPQRIYPMDHDAMGRLDIFLVPIGPRDGGMAYEAIFT